MTEYTTPIATAFELQRSTIEQSQRALENSIELQKRMNTAVVDGFESQEEAQRQGVELTRTALHSYLDAVEASLPGSATALDQVRESVDEQFDTLEEQHGEAFDLAGEEFEKGSDAYDDLAADYLAALNEQIDLLLSAHEDIEAGTLEAFERTERQFEEMQSQFEDQSEQFQSQFEEQAEQFQERFQEQFEQFQAQLEEMQARVEEVQERAQDSLEA